MEHQPNFEEKFIYKPFDMEGYIYMSYLNLDNQLLWIYLSEGMCTL